MSDHHDDDLATTKTEGFKVGEKKTLQEYQELGEFHSLSPLSRVYYIHQSIIQFQSTRCCNSVYIQLAI